MTENQALESILGDLSARGYDDAKLGVARNVLTRFARFLGDRPLSAAGGDDLEGFLARVTQSGASEKAVAVFRQVVNDSAPSLGRLRREALEAEAAQQTAAAIAPEPEPLPEPEPEPTPEPVAEVAPPAEAAPAAAPIEPAGLPFAPEPPPPMEEPPIRATEIAVFPPSADEAAPPIPFESFPQPDFEPLAPAPTMDTPPIPIVDPYPSVDEPPAAEPTGDVGELEPPPDLPEIPPLGDPNDLAEMPEEAPVDVPAPEPLPDFPMTEPADSLPSFPMALAADAPQVSFEPPPPVDPAIGAMPFEAPPAVEAAPLPPPFEPPAALPPWEPRETMVASLAAPPPEPAVETPVEVPADLVASLTPRLTGEMPPVPARDLIAESAASLLEGAPAEPPPASLEPAAGEDPREAKRRLVRDSLPSVLPTLLGHLEGDDATLRDEARELLGEAGMAAAPMLADSLGNGSDALTRELFGLLSELPGAEVPRLVVDRLRSGLVEPHAIVAAGGEEGIRMLLRRFTVADEHERPSIGGWIEGNPEISVAPLVEAQDSHDPELRGYAMRVLGLFGRPEAIPGLLRALDSTDEDARASSAMALVRMGRAAVDGVGEILLGTTDSDVQYEAAKALGYIGHASAAPYLEQAIAEGRVPLVAADALVRLGAPAVRGLLEELLGSERAEARRVAAETLERLGSVESKPALLARLGDEDTAVRDAVRHALEALGVPLDEIATAQGEADSRESTLPAAAADWEASLAATAGRLATGDAAGALSDADALLRHRAQLPKPAVIRILLEKAKAHAALGQDWEAVGALDQLLFLDDGHDEARALHEAWSKRIQ